MYRYQIRGERRDLHMVLKVHVLPANSNATKKRHDRALEQKSFTNYALCLEVLHFPCTKPGTCGFEPESYGYELFDCDVEAVRD